MATKLIFHFCHLLLFLSYLIFFCLPFCPDLLACCASLSSPRYCSSYRLLTSLIHYCYYLFTFFPPTHTNPWREFRTQTKRNGRFSALKTRCRFRVSVYRCCFFLLGPAGANKEAAAGPVTASKTICFLGGA